MGHSQRTAKEQVRTRGLTALQAAVRSVQEAQSSWPQDQERAGGNSRLEAQQVPQNRDPPVRVSRARELLGLYEYE